MNRWATFDCYGTLVDWETGIGNELGRLWPEQDVSVLRDRYHEIEPRVELEGSIAYRDVLRQALVLLAESEGLELAADEQTALADSLPRWPVFPEVPGALAELRARGWRLVPLSNTDADLLAASMEAIGVPFDGTVVAGEIGSYKPAHGHWIVFSERFGADPDRHVHVAASLFHDIAPGGRARRSPPCGSIASPRRATCRARPSSPISARLPDTLDALVPPDASGS